MSTLGGSGHSPLIGIIRLARSIRHSIVHIVPIFGDAVPQTLQTDNNRDGNQGEKDRIFDCGHSGYIRSKHFTPFGAESRETSARVSYECPAGLCLEYPDGVDVYLNRFANTKGARQAAPIERQVSNNGRATFSARALD